MPTQEHDDWLSGLGIDVDQIRQTITGGGSPGFNPSLDPSQLDAAARNANAFVKGGVQEAKAFLDSVPVRAVDPTAPIRDLSAQGIDALVSGDPSKIDPVKALTPSTNIGGIDLNNPGATIDQINNPADQQRAVATGQAILNQLADPIGGTVATAKAELNLAQSDPEKFSEQLGAATVRGGIALGLGLAGVGEAGFGGAADAGAAGGAGDVGIAGAAGDTGGAGAGAAADTGSIAADSGAVADAGAVKPSPLAQTGGGPGAPPESAPPETFDPAAPGSAGSDPNAGPFGNPSGNDGPFTPRPPSTPAPDPAPPSLPPDTVPDPPFQVSPPSQLPDGPPPDTQPIPVKPGFPFGTDDP